MVPSRSISWSHRQSVSSIPLLGVIIPQSGVHLSFQSHRIDTLSQSGANEEIVRFDCQGLSDLKLIGRIIHSDIKVLQNEGNSQDCFLPGERTSNTPTSPISKYLKRSQQIGPFYSPERLTLNAFCGNLAKLSPYILSGLKSSASAPKAKGSYPTLSSRTVIGAPCGMVYFPARTVGSDIVRKDFE